VAVTAFVGGVVVMEAVRAAAHVHFRVPYSVVCDCVNGPRDYGPL
jgi:hypothetical protein